MKDEKEIELIRKAGELVKISVEASLSIASPGITEIEIDTKGTHAILFESSKFQKMTAISECTTPTGIERTVMPHIASSTRKLDKRDIGIHNPTIEQKKLLKLPNMHKKL